MHKWRAWMSAVALSTALVSAISVEQAFGLDVSGVTVGTRPTLISGGGIYPVPGSVKTPAVFKLRIRVITKGRSLLLCLGTQSDFSAGTCPQPIENSSRDASGQFRDGLGVVDTAELLGKLLYVKNITSGVRPNDVASFTLAVE